MDVVNKTKAGTLTLEIPENSTALLLSSVNGEYEFSLHPNADIEKNKIPTFIIGTALCDILVNHKDLLVTKLEEYSNGSIETS